MPDFADRYPRLFHVTRRSALDGIARHGLRPAATFLEAPGDGANRLAWTSCPGPDGREVWLRWQGMRDEVLARRLPPSIEPSQWRGFINTMVFLSPSMKDAEGLRRFPRDEAVDQVILGFETSRLLEAGCALRTCAWNNGYPDRANPPRIRAYADYRPISDWRPGDKVREVTIAGPVPDHVPFEIA